MCPRRKNVSIFLLSHCLLESISIYLKVRWFFYQENHKQEGIIFIPGQEFRQRGSQWPKLSQSKLKNWNFQVRSETSSQTEAAIEKFVEKIESTMEVLDLLSDNEEIDSGELAFKKISQIRKRRSTNDSTDDFQSFKKSLKSLKVDFSFIVNFLLKPILLPLRSKKAGRFEKLLGFARSPFFVTRGESLVQQLTTPFLLF